MSETEKPDLPTEHDDEKDGSPAQTGRRTEGHMGTQEGSGWAPQGDRFGDNSTEGRKEDDRSQASPAEEKR